MFRTSRSALCGGLCILSLSVTPFVLGGCRTMAHVLRPDPAKARKELMALTADEAFQKLHDEKEGGLFWGDVSEFFGLGQLSPEEVTRQAYETALQGSQDKVKNAAVEEIALQFKDSCVGTLLTTVDSSGPRYAIYIPAFDAEGAEIGQMLDVDALNRELRRTLQKNPEFQQRFRLISCTREEAEQYMRDISGINAPENDPAGGADVVDPSRVCRLTGTWSASKSMPPSGAPRLTVISYVSAIDPKKRSVLDDQKFLVTLVYHPVEGWCTEQADAARAARLKSEAVAMNQSK